MDVHSTAVVADGAEIGEGTWIGPFCVIGPKVRLGAGCRLQSHVVIDGDTEVGPGCEFWPQTVLGSAAQHRGVTADAPLSRLIVGADCRFREFVTINTGSSPDSVTRVGSDCLFLTAAHVGHDATLGDHVTMTNGAMAAGHSTIEDRAIIGALAGVHQFTRIGRLAMIGGGSMVERDAPPYAMIHGDRANIRAVNLVGMRRAKFSPEDIAIIKRTYRILFWRRDVIAERIARVRGEFGDHPLVLEILNFMEGTKRGVLMARGRNDITEHSGEQG